MSFDVVAFSPAEYDTSDLYGTLCLLILATGQLYILEDIYFNYERNHNYTFTFRAKDDVHWSDPKTLYIEIIDKNERPQFTYTQYTLELDEETVSCDLLTSVSTHLQHLPISIYLSTYISICP